MSRSPIFDHEKLDVYNEAVSFVTWSQSILETIPSNLPAKAQLQRAATSIPLNIAEGNGKFSTKDRCRYFDIARGSALECAACLDVLKALDFEKGIGFETGRTKLRKIVMMLVGLIRSNSSTRKF